MTRSPADLERSATQILPGTSSERVRELLGEPLVESDLADGGLTWLYIEADPEHGQGESLSVAFDASGRFKRLERKSID